MSGTVKALLEQLKKKLWRCRVAASLSRVSPCKKRQWKQSRKSEQKKKNKEADERLRLYEESKAAQEVMGHSRELVPSSLKWGMKDKGLWLSILPQRRPVYAKRQVSTDTTQEKGVFGHIINLSVNGLHHAMGQSSTERPPPKKMRPEWTLAGSPAKLNAKAAE
ncbi:Hypothetical predicted protein [Pelobates cultripes]|uniref:Uncharacterized protein n=1 Tax=Pelobates cultripes TaxID=61616 RepID=A0AAD1VRS5_PELCU|nr:Hypothetical predicted protein [Pelobates cultripes]